jgi:AraC family transcriptional regulator, transcriptional activator of pobA
MIKVHQFDGCKNISIDTIELKNHDVFINEPHTHNFYEIGFFEKGEGTHTIDFTAFPIKQNTVYFLKKGIVHTLFREQGSFGKVISFDEALFIDNHLKQKLLFVEPHIYLDDKAFNFLKQLVNQIENYILHEKSKKELVANYLQLILTFFENYAATNIDANEKIHSFLAYVDMHFSAKLTVDDCCTKLNISYQQLYNEVHKKLNKTPFDLLKERLVLQAKRLLFNTEQSIKEIAFELEFEDASYFSKYFKTHTSESPIAFRENTRK